MFDSATQIIAAQIIAATGVATFFFGFGAGALLNLYLTRINSPLVAELRGSLNYISSIVGDGVLLPVVNMVAVAFLLHEAARITATVWVASILLGLCVTTYFHLVQAIRGLVNWAMPEPWRWNALGAFHAAYMLAVATLISMFYVVTVLAAVGGGAPWMSAVVVSAGMAAFFVLLRLDYAAVEWRALLPGRGGASAGR